MSPELVISLAVGTSVVALGLAAAALARLVRAKGAFDGAAAAAVLVAVGVAAVGLATAAALLRRPDGAPLAASPARVSPSASLPEAHGGRSLQTDPRRLAEWQDVEWPLLRMHLRVPPSWVVRRLNATDLVVHDPLAPTTFVAARAAPLPAGPTVAQYLDAHVVHLRDALDEGRIAGFATRPLGPLPGVLALEHREADAAWTVTWTAFEPAEVGSVAVTITAGAADTDFPRDESLLGAALASIRFE